MTQPRSKTSVLEIDGLSVKVTRKRMKKIRLKVLPPKGEIAVSCPYFTPNQTIIKFVRSKRSWIEQARSRVLSKENNMPEDFKEGEILMVFGEKYTMSVCTGERRNFALCGDRAVLTVREGDDAAQRQKTVEQRLRCFPMQ